MEEIGSFDITSGNVIVSDPCYTLDTWCQGKLEKVKNGKWSAFCEKESSEGRIASLTALLEGQHSSVYWRKTKIDVGVDSGQAGIFDESVYQKDETIKKKPAFDATLREEKGAGDKWYNTCCDITLDEGCGVIPGGVVSSSGWGDGSYECFIAKNKNDEIIGIKIVFIDNDEEEKEE